MFKAAKDGSLKVITSHRLDDGLVVFLMPDGNWSREIAAARLLEDAANLEEATTYANAQHDARVVIEPYAIEVQVSETGPVPIRLRERIRAEHGPTVVYGAAERAKLARQSA